MRLTIQALHFFVLDAVWYNVLSGCCSCFVCINCSCFRWLTCATLACLAPPMHTSWYIKLHGPVLPHFLVEDAKQERTP